MISESVIFTIGTDQISKCIADYYKVPTSHVRIRADEDGKFVADVAKEAAKWLCVDFVDKNSLWSDLDGSLLE